MSAQATAEFYRSQQTLTAAVIRLVRRQWGQMGADFDASWHQIGPRLVAVIAAGQLNASRQVEPYLDAVLEETEQDAPSVARLNPLRFTGVAADGRRIAALAYGGVITARMQIAQGAQPVEALAIGGRWLDMATQTAIADTSRSATATAIAARPALRGYTRFVNNPSCSRCSVLAGKTFAWNAGFLRHPRCDCRHEPTTRPPDDWATPRNMAPAVTDRRLSGATLMPEHVLRRTSDRDEAITLLAAAGFLR